MKLKYIRILLIFITVTAVGVFLFFIRKETEPPEEGSLESWTAYMNERIPVLMEELRIPGLIMAIIEDGETVRINAYGYADQEKGIPMTEDTRCRVESISKSITAWGVLRLVEKGIVDKKKNPSAYLNGWTIPDSPYSEEKITLEQLLNHTSGMELGHIGILYDPQGELPSLEESLSNEVILFREPGMSYSYSNAGYNLLELLIEDTVGKGFAEYMSDEVLKPLAMESSSFTWDPQWQPGVPKGYDMKGKPIPVYVYPAAASGGLFATAGDIASFVAAGMKQNYSRDPLVLHPETIEEIYQSPVKLTGYYALVFDGYSHGLFMETLDDGTFTLSNGGQGSGWMTFFQSVPETGQGIVILCNSQRSWPLFSNILADWSRWAGIPPVGMSLISSLSQGLKFFLFLSFSIMIYVFILFAVSLRRGRREFIWANSPYQPYKIGQVVLATLPAAVVSGVSRMEYFFLNSVFPVETPWLGWGAVSLSGLLLLFALAPEKK